MSDEALLDRLLLGREAGRAGQWPAGVVATVSSRRYSRRDARCDFNDAWRLTAANHKSADRDTISRKDYRPCCGVHGDHDRQPRSGVVGAPARKYRERKCAENCNE